MKLVVAATIASGLMISLGIAMLAPVFIQQRSRADRPTVLLTFSVTDGQSEPDWCDQVSSIVNVNKIKAVVFLTGKVADRYPSCVAGFGEGVDIGSQTYSYVELDSISDYSLQLEEVRNGKRAVDDAGELDSRLFRAPYGSIDENIYSLLTRAGIIADFSYTQQYNKYYDGHFVWFNLTVLDGRRYAPQSILEYAAGDLPVQIIFDSSTPLEDIEASISALKSGGVRFVNASELTGLDLTVRGES